ncbi:ABC transporter ATP-binding protein [Rubrolithibacter danxiaensis]|uniref:ABC transporter ATP-binding protein n=1 Tax=Rubrolithibacter danxiaensis TaxID=3390805 RepID=UPI003BF89012
MRIDLENIGRRFNREWIFRGVTYGFEQGSSYAILGPNGSGKSTLLQVIAANLTPSEGKIDYLSANKKVDIESAYKYLSWSAPYIELIEEFTLQEQLDFHFKFKPYANQLNSKEVIELLGLEKSKNKTIRFFSSGMKQRTKLALSFCSDTPVLLLDEPTSNLDLKGIDWYYELVNLFSKDRLLIICSNQEHEYSFCQHKLHLADYKQV